MKYKPWLMLAALFGAAVLCLGGASAPALAGDTITLSYANFPPPGTFPHVQMERWVKEVENRTKGKVKIKMFPGGSLLNGKNMVDGVINGQADIGCTCTAYQPGRFVTLNATSVPLGIPSGLVGSQVLMDLYLKYKPKSLAKVKVLTAFTTSPANIMSKEGFPTLDSLKGKSLRASGGLAQILKVWGANAVGMPMPATPEALQKGVVVGLFSSVEVMKDFKFAEYCRFVTMTDTSVYPFIVVMNLDKWNKLPKDVQEVMDGLFREQGEWTGKYVDDHAKEALDWSVKTYKVKIFNLSPEEKAKFDAPLKPMVDDWIKKVGAKGVDGKAIVADIQALVEKYSK